jgi:hypothetical protein
VGYIAAPAGFTSQQETAMKNLGRLWRTFMGQNPKKQNVSGVCNLIRRKSATVHAMYAD